MTQLRIDKPAVTEMARRLSQHLSSVQQVTLQHTHAMDALAATFGYRNRQTMCAEIKSAQASAPALASAAEMFAVTDVIVHTLSVLHRHGEDISVHATEEDAKNALFAFVQDWWSEAVEGNEEALSEMVPAAMARLADGDELQASHLERDEAIWLYFEMIEDESYGITRHEMPLAHPLYRKAPEPDSGPQKTARRMPTGAQVSGPWTLRDRAAAIEQGYALEGDELGRYCVIALDAPDVGDITHGGDGPAAVASRPIRIADIRWDTDGDDPAALGLPVDLVIDAAAESIEDPDAEIADWLSDRYGWCVVSFTHSPADADDANATRRDAQALEHVREIASMGDATAIRALRLLGRPEGSEAGSEPVVLYECDECGHTAPREAMKAVRNPGQRMDAGDTFTDCECHRCGALAFPVAS